MPIIEKVIICLDKCRHLHLRKHADKMLLFSFQTGDQVLRVNDLNVNGALHKEVAALVRAGTEVRLHVKSTGLIPVKNNSEDPLSWVLVEPNEVNDSLTDHSGYQSSISSLGTNRSTCNYENPVKIVINGAGKSSLGCSICKGPAEKPGIFVQRVRDRGIAQESGLLAGDQILSCNGRFFQNSRFSTVLVVAVQSMKSSTCLRLEVLRGVGMDMIAGESSGYNSSASSETGEESFCHCESDCREVFPQSLSTTLKRLNGITNRIQLDPNRDWKEIEEEWADAEVSEKRSQLETSQTLLSRKLNQKTPVSKSFLNLTINEVDEEPYINQRLSIKS
ncbi:Harmonin [Armadillidium nasatum]|uniref:Harmonin n=1 Tax=Armadillidium nasatum TaxID=96803 RepID=A0A5N5SYJ8_9CRUS|nr:Harmonin [Armadillidium nasatum]